MMGRARRELHMSSSYQTDNRYASRQVEIVLVELQEGTLGQVHTTQQVPLRQVSVTTALHARAQGSHHIAVVESKHQPHLVLDGGRSVCTVLHNLHRDVALCPATSVHLAKGTRAN